MSPYRIPSPPPPRVFSWAARWQRAKRAIVETHALGQSRWWRRWAGGRWALVAILPIEKLVIIGSGALDDVTVRWRPVDECPHKPVRDDAVWLCTCETWP